MERAMPGSVFFDHKLEETGCPRRPLRRLPKEVVTVADLVNLPFMPEMEGQYQEQLARWMVANGLEFGMPIPGKREAEQTTPMLTPDDEEFAEVQTLLQGARILCTKIGLSSAGNGETVSGVLDAASGYFAEGSTTYKALTALSHAADLDLYQHEQGEFAPADVAAAIELLAELLVLRKIHKQ